MEHVKTLHIVGFKNSGKTTLVSRWIRLLKGRGYAVTALKQHRHNGKLKMPDEQADSMQFFENGADSSIVSGGGAVQIMLNERPNFTRLKQLATMDDPDILFIEGFKEETGDKVVILRKKEDWDELQQLQGIQLVVGCPELDLAYSHTASRENGEQLDKWLFDWLKGGRNR